MYLSLFLLRMFGTAHVSYGDAVSKMHQEDVMKLSSTAGLRPKVENNAISRVFLQQRQGYISYLRAIL